MMNLLKIASQAWMQQAGKLRRAGLFKKLESVQRGVSNPGMTQALTDKVQDRVSQSTFDKYDQYILNKRKALSMEASFNDHTVRMRKTKPTTNRNTRYVDSMRMDAKNAPVLDHGKESEGIFTGNKNLLSKHNITLSVNDGLGDMGAHAYVDKKHIEIPSTGAYLQNYAHGDAKYRQNLSARHEINEVIDYNRGLRKDFAGHTHPSILVRDSALIAKSPDNIRNDVSMLRHGGGEIRGLNSMHRRGGGGDFIFGESAKFNPEDIKAVDKGHHSYMATRETEANHKVDLFNSLAKKHNDATDRIRNSHIDAYNRKADVIRSRYGPLLTSFKDKEQAANSVYDGASFHRYKRVKEWLNNRIKARSGALNAWDDNRSNNIDKIIDHAKDTIDPKVDKLNIQRHGDSMFQSFKIGF